MSCFLSVPALNDVFHVLRIYFSETDIYQGSNNDPHHVVEESVPRYRKFYGAAVESATIESAAVKICGAVIAGAGGKRPLLPLDVINGSNGGFGHVTPGGHKAPEIMLPN